MNRLGMAKDILIVVLILILALVLIYIVWGIMKNAF